MAVRLYSTTCAGFRLGESVLLVDSKQRQRLVKLTEGGRYQSHAGHVTHSNLLSLVPGETISTSLGLKVTVRRPSLWEYVRLMTRGPTPSYPKDIWAMLGLLDVCGGQSVLEAGSGSGGLTLYLSRAVGPSGHVYSFDNSLDHLKQAQANYNHWNHWHAHDCNDNVSFIPDTVANATTHIQTPLDAVALDLVDPPSVLDGILPTVKPGASLVAYLPNVSQVMSLRSYSQSRPLLMERVIEVIHRDWTVKSSHSKHNRTVQEDSDPLMYIARPSHNQQPHTAFLVHMRTKPYECTSKDLHASTDSKQSL